MSPRSKEAFEQLQKESKEKILLTALRIFVKKGLQTPMSEIAREAGISKGLIFHYFASREDLLIALLDMSAQGSKAALFEKIQQTGSATEAISAISELMVEALQSNDITTSLFLLNVQLSVSQPTPIIMEKLAENALPLDMLAQLVAAGQTEGTIKKGDPLQLASLYWAAVQGICCFLLSGMQITVSKELLDRILLK